MSRLALLTTDEMYTADRMAGDLGTPGPALMEAAGFAVALECRARFAPRRTVVLCGPGNNGGDGFVAARRLHRRGWPVTVALLGGEDKRGALKGDAAWAASLWPFPVRDVAPEVLDGAGLVVDALFGAGLSRPLDGKVAETVERIGALGLPCIAVDVPSGVLGDTGAISGTAPDCVATVTFFRAKPGHWLMPGRAKAGDLVIKDIGIPEAVLDDVAPRCFLNGPDLWRLPGPSPQAHKYDRGDALVLGGAMSGAARLVARGARRIGAGLVRIAAPLGSLAAHEADWPGTIVLPCDDAQALTAILDDPRKNALALGPGLGTGAGPRAVVLAGLGAKRATVLDADALSAFADEPETLFKAIRGPTVLTPHDGEFRRLFALEGDRLDRARRAARASGAVVVLKGPDTVVAEPGGRAVINANAPPDLATAGSGDVLSGMILGLLAQGRTPFLAAAQAVWIHGACAARRPAGLIAEDVADAIPHVLRGLRETL